MNNSRIVPIWQILFLFLFASFGIHKLFLFLFVQKRLRKSIPMPIHGKNNYSLITGLKHIKATQTKMVKKTQCIEGKIHFFLAFSHPDWFLPYMSW